MASPSTQSNSSSGEDPETSLAQQAPEHHPIIYLVTEYARGGDLHNWINPEMSLAQQAFQHDPVSSPSTQSTSNSGADPETSLAQQGPQHDPMAFPSTQSTCSSGGVPETSLAQQAFQYQPVAFLFVFGFFEMEFCSCCSGCVQWRDLFFTTTSASQVQAILLPQPPK